jgi:5'-phosphate synthase pdxT subunit
MKIGVLASQGDFAEHIITLKKLNVETVAVRLPGDLAGVDGLVIPGGESTTISRLMAADDLRQAIAGRAAAGMPIFGTCAGMILIAREITGNHAMSLDLMDIKVRRNAFGRQLESFEAELDIPAIGAEPFHAVFIRAPLIEACRDGVEVLARLENGTIVAARQGRLLAASFHPELTDDLRFHRYFLEIVSGER